MRIRVLNVVGARPNFMKIAPLIKEMNKRDGFDTKLVHTGQHYDLNMAGVFSRDLELPEPDRYLNVGSASHAVQMSRIMTAFEKVVLEEGPDLVCVVGDVNSTFACALVATRYGVKVAHVEAGLRSFDRNMPEEINRLLTDQISDYLFITEESGRINLLREGIAENKVHFVGNVMVDSLLQHLEKSSQSRILNSLQLHSREYAVLTLHRPGNVDNKKHFTEIWGALDEILLQIPVVFPIHPRSRKKLDEFGFSGDKPGLKIIDPVGYLDFLQLMSEAKFTLTDSGGIQEETTALNIPCLTLRENTERPVTVSQGTNTVIGTSKERIVAESLKILKSGGKSGKIPELWDGRAAERIVDILHQDFNA